MNWIQALLIVSIVVATGLPAAVAHAAPRPRRGSRSAYVLFVIAGVYAILRPDDTTVVANWLGVDRGTDLMEYALIIAFVFTTLQHVYAVQGPGVALRPAGESRCAAGRSSARRELGVALVAEEVDGLGDAVVEFDLRRPAQHLLGPADVEAGPPQVAETRRVELRLVGCAGGGGDRRMQLAD